MARQFTKFQQKAIKNFYDNKEAIGIQRLGELVTDLYLAEGKARATKWKQAAGALEKLGVKAPEIDKIVKNDDPTALAKKLEQLMAEQE
ncbi:hypothetical protein [Adhaeretor mobilis]|uniref:Uncharacterized protein n=1 Tax=Adhaeretor mobilis TaxID=1930276 RepID=A0A517N1P3_9BACT|nr:hypothetical protein [Adhaeretor mobilis]QDT01059.1 hypothetical protein HG15A2_44010 [Adhaeretor mobilis]